MISNPPPQPNIGISNLLRWPGEEGPPMPKKSIKHGVVETLMVRTMLRLYEYIIYTHVH
jgi:hypothetical protein